MKKILIVSANYYMFIASQMFKEAKNALDNSKTLTGRKQNIKYKLIHVPGVFEIPVVISKNVKIGKKTRIGFGTVIRANKIRIGRFVRIGSITFIDTGSISIDDDSKINEQVLIAGIRRPESSLTLGKRTTIMEYSYINPTMPIDIGDDSGIGGHCLLFTHGSWLNQLDGFPVKSIIVDSIPILHFPPSNIILIFFPNSSKTSFAQVELNLVEIFALGAAKGLFIIFKIA